MEHVLASIDITSRVSNQTNKLANITHQTEKDLKLLKVETKPWLINSFWSIGWPDPFPDEHTNNDGDFL